MKQTNNAIKFLMAQYRAIFKSAYVKGLATAVVLTSALATGQAQAADLDDTAWQTVAESVTVNTGDTYDKLTLTEAAGTNSSAKPITITLAGAGSTIAGSAGAATITGKNITLDINGDSADLTIDGTSQEATLDIAALKVTKGELTFTEGQAMAVNAKAISVGSKGASGDTATVTLVSGTTLGTTIAAGDISNNTTLSVTDGAKLLLESGASASTVTINAPLFNMNGGEIATNGDGASGTVGGTINLVSGTMDAGKIAVVSGDTLKFAFSDTKISDKANSVDAIDTSLALNSGDLDIKGTLDFSGKGTVTLGDVTVTGNADAAITVNDDTTLSLSAAKLAEVAAAAKLTVSGASSSAILNINDQDKQIDLGDFTFGSAAAVATSTIGVGTNTTIAGKDLLLSDALGEEVGSVKADALTIKANSAVTDGDYKAGALDVKNSLTFDGAVTYAKDINLGNEQAQDLVADKDWGLKTSQEKIDAFLGNTGTINATNVGSGTFDSGASLNVISGKWNSSANITLGGTGAGTLTVGSGAMATDGTTNIESAAYLSFDKGTTFTVKSGTITIGNDNVATTKVLAATMDLTKAKVDLSQIAGTSAINVTDNGTLLVSEKTAAEMVSATQTDLTTTLKSGGILVVDGDLTIDGTTELGQRLVFDSNVADADGNVATLKADNITINSAATVTVSGGAIETGTLLLNDDAGATSLTEGTYTVTNKLGSTQTGTTITLTGDANKAVTLNLGALTVHENADGSSYYEATLGGESRIDSDLVLTGNATSGTAFVNVNAGNWNGENLKLGADSVLTVGALNGKEVIKDKSGNTITAGLNANALTLESGSAVVNANGSAQFNTLSSTSGNIEVKGALTFAGKHTAADADKSITESWGVDTSNVTGITIDGRNANLTLGNVALGSIKEITATTDTETGKVVYNNDVDTFGQNITISGFGTLTLDFGEQKFTVDQIKTLRQEFFANNKGEALTEGYINLGDATVEGVNVVDGKISIEDLNKIQDIQDIVVTDLATATVTGVTASDVVQGNVGNILADGSTNTVTLGDATLNMANPTSGYFAVNEKGDLVNLSVKGAAHAGLKNGGTAGNISLASGTSELGQTIFFVASEGDALTTLNSVNGGKFTQFLVDGNTKVKNNVSIDNLVVNKNLDVTGTVDVKGDLTSTADTGTISTSMLNVDGETNFRGNITVTGDGAAVFNSAAYLGGNNSFNDVTFNSTAEFDRGITTADTMRLSGSLNVIGNAQVTAAVIEGEPSNAALNIMVGEEAGSEGAEKWDSSAGYLTVGRLDLNGGRLMADPDYSKAASIVAVNTLGNRSAISSTLGNAAGTLNGEIIALRNSIIALGVQDSEQVKAVDELKSTFAQYIEADGSLQQNGVGSMIYVAKALDLDENSRLVADSSKTATEYLDADTEYQQLVTKNNAYIAKNSVLAVSDEAAMSSFRSATVEGTTTTSQRAAIHFDDASASVYAEKGAKVVLVGDGFNTRSNISLFSDNGSVTGETSGVWIRGNNLTVETLNGLLTFTYDVNKETTDRTLGLNYDKIDSAFNQASAPVKNTLISYAANDNNWGDIDSQNYKADVLHGDSADKTIAYDNANGFTAKKDGSKVENPNDYIAVAYTDAEGNTAYHVYEKSYNYFLDEVVRNSNTGIEAETAARLGVFGGSVQAAMTAGSATTDAIAGRFGMGAQVAGMTYADNGQGTGLWVTPIYRNADSDGFAAQGVSYGTDLNLYGVALGGDYTLANGLRVGAMFNIGSGDADGQGAGSLATNDFDYYGFAAFAGYTMGQFTVVGDISYTVVDNEVTANTAVDKIGANFDTSNLSVGVTGQYALNFNGTQVTPHAGLRFSSIDMDDYTVDGKDVIAKYNGDTMNVFSIPVGVTIAKEYEGETWTLKPSFDLTLTGQFGDDEAEGTVEWAGIDNLTTGVTSEVFDNFTYGATVGVAAKTGNLSLGFGLNYTGSSNVDEFGVNANARYVF